MDCEIRLAGASPRERRTRKTTSTTAIVNNENAMTNNATCWPVEATANGTGAGNGARGADATGTGAGDATAAGDRAGAGNDADDGPGADTDAAGGIGSGVGIG